MSFFPGIIIIIIIIIINIIIITIILVITFIQGIYNYLKSQFFSGVNEATETFLWVGLTQGILVLWRRLASSPAAQRQFLSDGLILKTSCVHCVKNWDTDYIMPMDRRVNKE